MCAAQGKQLEIIALENSETSIEEDVDRSSDTSLSKREKDT
jgi:hypothetical protein